MLFTSFIFFILVILTLLFYYNRYFAKYQVYILIIASFIFYAYGQPYLLLLLFLSASINAIISYMVYFEESRKKRIIYATIGVVTNLVILIFFKYSPLFAQIFKEMDINSIGEFLITIPLPIGISFYTFQGISLVVDLYRNRYNMKHSFKVKKDFKEHYINTIFFISFFPQLIAGPIVKSYQFYPQIKTKYFKDIDLYASIRILILGYFLKIVIADNLAQQTFWMTYPYFKNFDSITLLVLLFGFSIQIFTDFAGYSLIAIGIAKLFGYELPKNFNFPYISKSFSEFWNRWHISLSTWLKEYLYIPLGGNRKGKVRTYINLFTVMLLGGFWHGASISYMIWGGYHGMLLAVERFFKQYTIIPSNILLDTLKVISVFILVTLGWLLFKLNDFHHVIEYLNSILLSKGSLRKDVILLIILYSLPVFVYYFNYIIRKKTEYNLANGNFIYGLMLFFIFTNHGASSVFIYFQF